MAYVRKTSSDAILTFGSAEATTAKVTRRRRSHAEHVLRHILEAKARKSGRDITDLSEEELIDDLRAHQQRA